MSLMGTEWRDLESFSLIHLCLWLIINQEKKKQRKLLSQEKPVQNQ